MAEIIFPFEESHSDIFGKIHRPVAQVQFWSDHLNNWLNVTLIVDTGADYTILPRFYAHYLGVNLKKECELHRTSGIGGMESVHLFRDARIRLGAWERIIPVGFISHSNVPPLLGRQSCIETFKLTLQKKTVRFGKL